MAAAGLSVLSLDRSGNADLSRLCCLSIVLVMRISPVCVAASVTEFESLLITPPGASPENKVPLILHPHGECSYRTGGSQTGGNDLMGNLALTGE